MHWILLETRKFFSEQKVRKFQKLHSLWKTHIQSLWIAINSCFTTEKLSTTKKALDHQDINKEIEQRFPVKHEQREEHLWHKLHIANQHEERNRLQHTVQINTMVLVYSYLGEEITLIRNDGNSLIEKACRRYLLPQQHWRPGTFLKSLW